jgi:LysR family transcriptional regulator, cell division regulator
VARLGGMNRAAGELNTVQSNVTARIRQLEAELGLQLFERHSRGVALTAGGRRLLPYAARIAELLADARRAVADDGTPKGPLALGSLETTAGLRLPPILAAYARAFPEVDLQLATGTSSGLAADVLACRLEGAFVVGPADHPDLVEEAMFREEMVLVTAPGVTSPEQLASRGEVKIVVFRAGCSYRRHLEAYLTQRGVARLCRLELGTLEGMLGCVGAGLGVTLLPRGVAAPAALAGRVALHELPPALSRATTVFIRRRDGFVSSALTAFLHCARGTPALQKPLSP